MNTVGATENLWPMCPQWQAAERAKARDRRELASLPPAEAQARVSHCLPLGSAKIVTDGASIIRRGRGLLGLAAILAAD